MDFSLLKSFVAVADEKSFSTAAKHLFISQQSLSKHIAKLEEELGTQLFFRSRPLSLTNDGKSFLKTAKGILHLKQQYEEETSRSFDGTHFIHMGIEHTIARAVLPYILPKYLKMHPDTYVKVNEESPTVLHKSLLYDGVDLVIGSILGAPDTYELVPLCKKEQLLIVPKTIMQELCGERYEQIKESFSKVADLHFFEHAPFIKIPRQSSGGRTLYSFLKYYDINPHFVCELTNVENAFQVASSGLGVLIYAKPFWDMMLPELQEEYLKTIDVFPLPYLPGIDDICAYYNKETGLNGKNKELLDTFISFFDEYNKSPDKAAWISSL